MRLARITSPDGALTAEIDASSEEFLPPSVDLLLPGSTAALTHPEPLDPGRLLAPVVPTKVIAVGLNYADHAAELGMDIPEEPVLFFKVPSSVVGPFHPVVLPPESDEVHYEAELAVVVGVRARRVSSHDVGAVVLGYTCANDVTARDIQRTDGQWSRCKSFDTFCPIGPWIDTELDPTDKAITARVNGAMRQHSRTSQMVFDVPALVSFVSGAMTLEPGDVILTGTPPGVGRLNAGDTVVIGVEGIGDLENPVRDE